MKMKMDILPVETGKPLSIKGTPKFTLFVLAEPPLFKISLDGYVHTKI